jgi:hypothetical protein
MATRFPQLWTAGLTTLLVAPLTLALPRHSAGSSKQSLLVPLLLSSLMPRADACGTSWGSYVLTDSGAAACGGCGEAVTSYDDCMAASASGMAFLGIGGLGGSETWDGPPGCHIQDGSNFQFNTNMDGGSSDGHTPVCLRFSAPTQASYAANAGMGNVCEAGEPITDVTECGTAAAFLATSSFPGYGFRSEESLDYAAGGCFVYSGPVYYGFYMNTHAGSDTGTADHHKICKLEHPPFPPDLAPAPPPPVTVTYAANAGMGNACEAGEPITDVTECGTAAAFLATSSFPGYGFRSEVEASLDYAAGGCFVYSGPEPSYHGFYMNTHAGSDTGRADHHKICKLELCQADTYDSLASDAICQLWLDAGHSCDTKWEGVCAADHPNGADQNTYTLASISCTQCPAPSPPPPAPSPPPSPPPPPPSPPPSPPRDPDQKSPLVDSGSNVETGDGEALSGGAIGGMIGGIAVFALVLGLVYHHMYNKRRQIPDDVPVQLAQIATSVIPLSSTAVEQPWQVQMGKLGSGAGGSNAVYM